jgi:zinc protease
MRSYSQLMPVYQPFIDPDKRVFPRQEATAAPSSLPGSDDITRIQLPNGIIVLARSNFNSPSVVVNGYLPVGSLYDSDEKLGLAGYVASALMRGTDRYEFQELYDNLESVGASLGFNAGTHTTGFSGQALVEDLDLLLNLLAESLRRPTFPENQVERLRMQLLTALAIRAQDTGEMASLTFDQLVYTGHPYGRPDDGFPETIQEINRSDLVEFQHRFYGPQGMVISVVGAVEPEAAVEKVTQALGDWENPQQPPQPKLPVLNHLAETTTRKVIIQGKSQADIVIGVAGPERRSPDYLAASLGNSVLGRFGMMGRIGEVVRERAGLAYYAYSSLAGGLGPGPWYVTAGVDPNNLAACIEMIQNEITRFVEGPVTQQELADSQANFIGRLPLSLESNGGVAVALLNLERYDLGLDYYRRYPDLVKAISVNDILETANRYWDPEHLGIAVAGPLETSA